MNIRRKIYDRRTGLKEFRNLHMAQNTLDRRELESRTGGPEETSKNLDRWSHRKDADEPGNDNLLSDPCRTRIIQFPWILHNTVKKFLTGI